MKSLQQTQQNSTNTAPNANGVAKMPPENAVEHSAPSSLGVLQVKPKTDMPAQRKSGFYVSETNPIKNGAFMPSSKQVLDLFVYKDKGTFFDSRQSPLPSQKEIASLLQYLEGKAYTFFEKIPFSAWVSLVKDNNSRDSAITLSETLIKMLFAVQDLKTEINEQNKNLGLDNAASALKVVANLESIIFNHTAQIDQVVTATEKETIYEHLMNVSSGDYDPKLLAHKDMSNAVAQKTPNDALMSVDNFKLITYEGAFEGSGTAKEKIVERLEKIAKKYPSLFQSANLSKIESLPDLKNLYEQSSVMQAIAMAWKNERSLDPNRAKRAYGFDIFILSIEKFKNSVDHQIQVAGKNQNKSDEEISQLTNQDNFSKENKETVLSVQQRYTSGRSAFANLAPMVKLLVPAPETKGTMQAGLEIELGGFAAAKLNLDAKFEAERGQVNTTLSADIGAKISGSLKFLELMKLEAGISGKLFVKAQAPSPEQALTLISYGVYKNLKDGAMSSVADWAWGGEYVAQRFSEATEEKIFNAADAPAGNDAPNVEVGGELGASLAFDINNQKNKEKKNQTKGADTFGAAIGAGYAYKKSTKYQKEKDGTKMESKKTASHTFSGDRSGSFTTGTWTFKGKVGFKKELGKDAEYNLALSASTTTSANIYNSINAITTIHSDVSSLLKKAQQQTDEQQNPQAQNSVEHWGLVAASLQSVAKDVKEQSFKENDAFVSKSSLGLELKINLTKKKGELTLSNSTQEGIEAKLSGKGVSASISTSKTLLKWAWEGGSFNFLGGGLKNIGSTEREIPKAEKKDDKKV